MRTGDWPVDISLGKRLKDASRVAERCGGEGERGQAKITARIRAVLFIDDESFCAHVSNVASRMNRRPPCPGHVS